MNSKSCYLFCAVILLFDLEVNYYSRDLICTNMIYELGLKFHTQQDSNIQSQLLSALFKSNLQVRTHQISVFVSVIVS